jgi:hypothetical protein
MQAAQDILAETPATDSNRHGPFIHTVAPRRAEEAEPVEQLRMFVVDSAGVVELVCSE